QDYALWDVIKNGNSFNPVPRITANAAVTSTSTILGPVTTEEKAHKKNDVKARSMLLLALSNEHLLTFSQYKDVKTLFEAIQARFGGCRKIVSQLAIQGENISQEDINMKFLRSLTAEWKTHIVVWRNKADIDTMSFDDLYNNFKIVEQEVKRMATSSSSSGSQNMDFLSSLGSTNVVDTANIQVSTVSTPVSTVSTHDNTANLSDATVGNRFEMAVSFAEYESKKVLSENWPRNQDSSRKTVIVEDTSSKAMVAIDRASFDWSYMSDDEVPINMAIMAFSDSESQVLMMSRMITTMFFCRVLDEKDDRIFCFLVIGLNVIGNDVHYSLNNNIMEVLLECVSTANVI
nr:ribonuclease H-like domain-containing protein [Tanacetum cinerariifolium]